MPYGPLEAITHQPTDEAYHVQHYERRDLEEILRDQQYTLEMVHRQRSPIDGSLLAWWVICIHKSDSAKPYYHPNYQRKFETTRPYVKVGLTAICKNEEDNITGFLKSFIDRVDEISLYDTGSKDNTIELAQRCLEGEIVFEKETDCLITAAQAPVRRSRYKIIKGHWDDDFGGARNRGLAFLNDVDWVVWADCDERLTDPYRIKKYIQQGDLEVYKGFIIKQIQMLVDQPQNTFDIPIRLFRANKDCQFFGCVHEHAQVGLNEYIEPVMIIPDMQFIHFGFTTEAIRRDKAINRNFALLEKDRKINPDRQLGAVLMMRDLIHIVGYYLEKRSDLDEKRIKNLNTIISLYEPFQYVNQHFHFLADIFYQQALKMLGERGIISSAGCVPIQLSFSLVGSHGELEKEYQPQTRWFLTPKEVDIFLKVQQQKLVAELNKVPQFFDWGN
jgi:glycosyltransferase involved in cell wall biosynthesis